MAKLWSCPCPDCPPTEFEPSDVTASEDAVAMSVCGGSCNQEHPTASFTRVTGERRDR
jgi:hypothetical protein